jgi:hypothetical protein
MNEIDQDLAIVIIHVIDIDDNDDVHHLIVEGQQGYFLIKRIYILFFFSKYQRSK